MAVVEFENNSSPYISAENLNEIQKANTYSTEEIEIGKWIDGKPIYRKVINLGALPNKDTSTSSSGISTSINVINIYGFAKSTNETFPLPFVWGSINEVENYCGLFYNTQNNQVWFRTNRNMSTYNGTCIIEYTKSTD